MAPQLNRLALTPEDPMPETPTDANRIDPTELIVKAKIRTLLSEAGMRASDEIWNELGHTVSRKVKEAIRRAKANGRKTLKAADF